MRKQKEIGIPIGGKWIGKGNETFVIAEIGINHNGSLDLAKALIDGATHAGCQAVKFQKRTPELCVPRDQWDRKRDTPWGSMTYIEYRHKIEFSFAEYAEIDRYCRERRILWFASCWDEPSVDFIQQFDPPLFKASSASLTDLPLLRKMKETGKPLILSTGMSALEELRQAVSSLGETDLLIAHSTSVYPCPSHQLNLRMIQTLQRQYPRNIIGYSGHEADLINTCAAVALGAAFVERHITLDRSLWGTDQAASIEIHNLARLVKDIREINASLGDGVKRVYSEEIPARNKLRRVPENTGFSDIPIRLGIAEAANAPIQ